MPGKSKKNSQRQRELSLRPPSPEPHSSEKLHCEDDAEFCFPAHHASVALSGFHQRKLFDHGADTGHFGEAQRVFGVGGDSRRPALKLFLPEIN